MSSHEQPEVSQEPAGAGFPGAGAGAQASSPRIYYYFSCCFMCVVYVCFFGLFVFFWFPQEDFGYFSKSLLELPCGLSAKLSEPSSLGQSLAGSEKLRVEMWCCSH